MSLDELLRAARAGEARAERRLYAEIRRELRPYFRRRVDESAVDDLVQESLAVIIAELPEFEPKGRGKFRSFVFSVAHNRVLTYRRQVARHRRAPGNWVPEPEPESTEIEEMVLWKERGGLVREALAVVRTTFRRAVESRLRDESPREFARSEGIRTGTVRTRVMRGIVLIREQLRARRRTARESTPQRSPTPG